MLEAKRPMQQGCVHGPFRNVLVNKSRKKQEVSTRVR